MNSPNRYAFCIIAHSQPELFKLLLRQIDHPENEIYVMIDKKTDINLFASTELKYSKIYFCKKRINIKWGEYSQVMAEIELFKFATSFGEHDYYHLLSGQDLLIKPVDSLNQYIKANTGHEFLGFRNYYDGKESVDYRLKYFHFHPHFCRSRNMLLKLIYKIPLKFQQLIGYHRKYPKSLQMGSNWCTITQSFVHLILKQEKIIRKTFRYALCCDELYKQFIAIQNDLFNRCDTLTFNGTDSIRKIDWERGRPYVWDICDLQELKHTHRFIARKFDSKNNQLLEAIMRYSLCE